MQKNYSRNYPIISKHTQSELSSCRIAFVGCGLGSNIAVLAARTGVKNFVLADGDKVEYTNLNRQVFNISDIGKNKALAVRREILKVLPSAKIQVFNNYITTQAQIDDIVGNTDVIINTADFTKGFYEILISAIKKNRFVITPFNVGFGSAVTTFNKNNTKVVNGLMKNRSKVDGHHFVGLIKASKGNFVVPQYFKQIFSEIVYQKSKLGYIPQLGLASNITASLVLKVLIDYLRRHKYPRFPIISKVQIDNV